MLGAALGGPPRPIEAGPIDLSAARLAGVAVLIAHAPEPLVYLVLRGRARFTIEGERTRMTVTFDRHFGFAQVYAPAGRAFVAVEPMTAPSNALVTGEYTTVARGDCYRASFEVAIARA